MTSLVVSYVITFCVSYALGRYASRRASASAPPPPPPERNEYTLELGMPVRVRMSSDGESPVVWEHGIYRGTLIWRRNKLTGEWGSKSLALNEIDEKVNIVNVALVVRDGDRPCEVPFRCLEPLPRSRDRELDEGAGYRDSALKPEDA